MAYTTCTVGVVSRADDGTVTSVTLKFTGDAGEIERKFEYVPGSGTKAEELLRAQQERDRTIATLNNKRALATAGGLEQGLVIGPAPAPAASTPAQIAATAWRRKIAQHNVLVPLGTIPAGALATQVAALKTAINDDFNNADATTKTAMAAAL